jgi:hypothetical protein
MKYRIETEKTAPADYYRTSTDKRRGMEIKCGRF